MADPNVPAWVPFAAHGQITVGETTAPCQVVTLSTVGVVVLPAMKGGPGLALWVEVQLPDRPTPLALAVAVRRALKVYREDRARWEALQDAGMATDFGWHAAAMRYVETYQNALDARREERVFG